MICDDQEREVRRRCQEWLRDAVADIGITQAELGRRIGLNRVQVNRLISGKRVWDPRTVADISETLRVPPPPIASILSDEATT